MKKYWIKSIKEIVNIRFNGFLSSEYIEYCGFYFEDVLVENELMGVVGVEKWEKWCMTYNI